MPTATQVPPNLPIFDTGSAQMDEVLRLLSDYWAKTVADLNFLFGTSGASAPGTAPTNQIVPTSISIVFNADGSLNATLTWDPYIQGVIPADLLVIVWKSGTSPLSIPTVADKAIGVLPAATVFTFEGINPSANYRFGVTAARRPTALSGMVAGAVVSPTSSPDWADRPVGGDGTANYTNNISGVLAATVVANAADGETSFSGTVNYRSTGAPTNLPDPDALSADVNTDASVDYTLGWLYTQGAKQADGFIVFVGLGNTTPVITDPHFELAAQPSGTFGTRVTLKGYPIDKQLSFAVAAFRRTDNALEIGAITDENGAPGNIDWRGVATSTPNYVGNIVGVEQHNWNLTAAGQQASGTLAGQIGLTRDGTLETWTYADEEYNGHTYPYGLSYNLLVYDLVNKQTTYAHCYDVFDYGTTAAVDADLIEPVATGTGVVDWAQAGKFGLGLETAAVDASNRAYFRTRAASAAYKPLRTAEVWFKRSGTPAAAGDILALSTTNGSSAAEYPILRLNTDGTVVAIAWDGAAYKTTAPSVVVTDGDWHWLRARFNGTTLRLAVDGHAAVTVATTAVAFATGAASNLFVLLGSGGLDLFGSINYYDELLLSDVDLVRTLPTVEASDYLTGAAGNYYIWHFQEPWPTNYFCNARKASSALANVIGGYNTVAGTLGDSSRYFFALHASNEPQANRLTSGLPAALASIGSNLGVFSSTQFQVQSAYALVGQPLLGQGNGLEYYAGTVANDPVAVCKIAFQTQGSKVIGLSGVGWSQSFTPGVPTNDPSGGTINLSTSDTGQRIHKLSWNYTQPALSGTNKLADGFMIRFSQTSTTTPAEQFIVLDSAARDYTFSWSLPAGAVVSYSIYAFRRTTSGIETGGKHQGTGWQGVVASLYVQSLEPGAPNGTWTNSSFAITNTTIATGNRTHKLTWVWTEGALPADGFILYYDTGSTTNPSQQFLYLNDDARNYTFEWSLAAGTTVSYAVAAFRRTIDGVEITSKQQKTGGTWAGVAADQVVQTSGLDDDGTTTEKRQNAGTQSFTINYTILANSGSAPVSIFANSHSFTIDLTKTPTATCKSNIQTLPVWVIGSAPSAITVAFANTGTTDVTNDGTKIVTVDYW